MIGSLSPADRQKVQKRKILRYCIFFFVFVLYAVQSWADQLIIEPDMGEKPIIQAINNAKHSIHLVMYGFTHKKILDHLIQQKLRGRNIKILLERKPYRAHDENELVIEKFKNHHIDWHGSIPSLRLIHQKTLVIDDAVAIVMTFNFTHSTFKTERNFALVVDDPERVQEIKAAFSADWNHRPTNLKSALLMWSPKNSREKILMCINQAKTTIRVYAPKINDYKILGALARAAQKKIKVNILTSNKINRKVANFLRRAGVVVCYNNNYFIHAKVLIIDDNKAVIGSINLTRPSLENNRELSVETNDTTVIKQLNSTFEYDWVC